MRRLPRKLPALPSPAFTWWKYGHQTVASTAAAGPTPKVKCAVARLVRPYRQLADVNLIPFKPRPDAICDCSDLDRIAAETSAALDSSDLSLAPAAG